MVTLYICQLQSIAGRLQTEQRLIFYLAVGTCYDILDTFR